MTTATRRDTIIDVSLMQLIDDIYEVSKNTVSDSMSLMGGETGKALFRCQYLKYKREIDSDEHLPNILQHIAESSIEIEYATYAGGKAGINWFFAYFGYMGLLDDEDVELLNQDRNKLTETAIRMMIDDNCDFFHGGIGVAYYLMYYKEKTSTAFYETFFTLLDALRQKCDDPRAFPNFDLKLKRIVPGEVNMGLAHGIPSIIKFCMQCYKQGICREQAKQLAYELIHFMMEHTNKDTSKSFFTHTLMLHDRKDVPSRLAWCYGDLGIAFILYQAGLLFKDDRIRDFALNVLVETTGRRTGESTAVDNPFICHGSSGLAYMYHKLWFYTGNPIFKETRDFWINKTFDFRIYNDGVTGFKCYDSLSKTWKNNYELLEGVAGIGLAMLSCVTNDFSWDYCLMLND